MTFKVAEEFPAANELSTTVDPTVPAVEVASVPEFVMLAVNVPVPPAAVNEVPVKVNSPLEPVVKVCRVAPPPNRAAPVAEIDSDAPLTPLPKRSVTVTL